jgi:hypothetical protein
MGSGPISSKAFKLSTLQQDPAPKAAAQWTDG